MSLLIGSSDLTSARSVDTVLKSILYKIGIAGTRVNIHGHRIDKLSMDIHTMGGRLDSHMGYINSMKSNIASTIGRVTIQQKTIDAASSRICMLESKTTAHSDELCSMHVKVASLSSTISIVKNLFDECNDSNKELSDMVNLLNTEVTALKKKNAELERGLEAVSRLSPCLNYVDIASRLDPIRKELLYTQRIMVRNLRRRDYSANPK